MEKAMVFFKIGNRKRYNAPEQKLAKQHLANAVKGYQELLTVKIKIG